MGGKGILNLAQNTASTPSTFLVSFSDELSGSKGYAAPNEVIDTIIKDRRDEHASSFGYKYLKDTMDNTKSNAVWGACLIPRLIIAPIYAFGKWNALGGLTYMLNPVNWMRGILGSLAMHAVSISPEARKEQAIRSVVEGVEEKPERMQKERGDMPYYASVYDSNKKYKGGVLGGIEEKLNKTLGINAGVIEKKFNGTPGEKAGLCKEIEAIKQQILEQLPGSENKSWVKKLSDQLKSLEGMDCTKP